MLLLGNLRKACVFIEKILAYLLHEDICQVIGAPGVFEKVLNVIGEKESNDFISASQYLVINSDRPTLLLSPD